MLLKYLGNRLWETKELIYYEDIIVPIGFITDLVSIPSFFFPFFLPYGKYIRASIIHDYLYVTQLKNKEKADLIFYEVMVIDNVHVITRTLFYYAVKWFGLYC